MLVLKLNVITAPSIFKCVSANDMFCIVDLPADHAFDVFNHKLTKQWGFYPRVPQALRNRDTPSHRAAV